MYSIPDSEACHQLSNKTSPLVILKNTKQTLIHRFGQRFLLNGIYYLAFSFVKEKMYQCILALCPLVLCGELPCPVMSHLCILLLLLNQLNCALSRMSNHRDPGLVPPANLSLFFNSTLFSMCRMYATSFTSYSLALSSSTLVVVGALLVNQHFYYLHMCMCAGS